jgi:hypothetical protein
VAIYHANKADWEPWGKILNRISQLHRVEPSNWLYLEKSATSPYKAGCRLRNILFKAKPNQKKSHPTILTHLPNNDSKTSANTIDLPTQSTNTQAQAQYNQQQSTAVGARPCIMGLTERTSMLTTMTTQHNKRAQAECKTVQYQQYALPGNILFNNQPCIILFNSTTQHSEAVPSTQQYSTTYSRGKATRPTDSHLLVQAAASHRAGPVLQSVAITVWMFDVWCLMFDAWCLMLDVWCLMFDAWCWRTILTVYSFCEARQSNTERRCSWNSRPL